MKNTTPFAAYLDEQYGRGASLERYLSKALDKKIHKQQITRIKQRGSKFPSHWMMHVVKWSKGELKLKDLAEHADKA